MTKQTTAQPPRRAVQFSDEVGFRSVFSSAQRGLSDAIDLILIHNERDVKGRQPRATLNPLTLMLAVAAWERLLADLSNLVNGHVDGVGMVSASPGGAYLSDNGKGAAALRTLTDEQLPGKFQVAVFDSWRGKVPTRKRTVIGSEIGRMLDDAIRHRNGVAHRSLPFAAGAAIRWSDARREHTIQAGWARGYTAMFVQLIDQTCAHISQVAGFQQRYRLPHEWFEAQPAQVRGVASPKPLWGGHSLMRTEVS